MDLPATQFTPDKQREFTTIGEPLFVLADHQRQSIRGRRRVGNHFPDGSSRYSGRYLCSPTIGN